MKKIIFHVGPGKCGSSSIQNSLALAQTVPAAFRSAGLDPSLLNQLASENYQSAEELFASTIQSDISDTDCMIYSHEYAFQVPAAIEAMVRIASDLVPNVVIVGYCRKPSSFIQAVYCQWMFRSLKRSREVSDALAKIGINSAMFSGLERHYISAIFTDFHTTRQLSGQSIIDWRVQYENIANRIAPYDAIMSIGTLPDKNIGISLLQDFYSRCGLLDDLLPAFLSSGIANAQYNINLVEAIQAAILAGEKLPGPHEDNEFLERASGLLGNEIEPESTLMVLLKARTDTMLWPSNKLFAIRHGLDETTFLPRNDVTAAQAIEAVRNEESERMAQPGKLLATRSRMVARMTRLTYDLYLQGQHRP